MHRMTREANGAKLMASFAGETFSFKGDTVTLTSDRGEHFFEIQNKGERPRIFRMTRVIGGRTREDYAGVAVTEAKSGAPTLGNDHDEEVMPVTYVFRTKSLRYKGYSVMVKERPLLHEGPTWNKTCIFCHNTVPYLDEVLGALSGSRGARSPYQGEVVDPLLPPDRRFAYTVTNDAELESIVRAEGSRLGRDITDAKPALAAGISAIRGDFNARSLVEVGIGCEACHNGSRAHAEQPTIPSSLDAKSPAFAIGPVGRAATHAETVNRVCARCHQVLFSGYPNTWEGGARHASPGGSNINSGEARDMMLGHCQAQLACTSCHDPHAEDNATKSATLTDAICTQCHTGLTTPASIEAHSHHRASGEGARCMACHMPRKNMSLEGKLTRYHRIGSPNEPQRVLLDRPVECALCHADKSVRELTDSMTAWWKTPYEPTALTRLYGSLDANVLLATAERGKPHEVAVAVSILGDPNGARWSVGSGKSGANAQSRLTTWNAVGSALTHDYPLVRTYARTALESLGGAPFDVDLNADSADIQNALSDYSKAHGPH